MTILAPVDRLPRDFFARPTLEVAPDLLGKVFFVNGLNAVIVETEAYLPDDPASHSFCGKTVRNAAMFHPPGTLYVYRSYGVHFCVNVATEGEGIGAAVLIRGVMPLPDSVAAFQVRRGLKITQKQLSNGPGKLCQAFGITLEQNYVDGTTSAEIGFFNAAIHVKNVEQTPRIGISKNTEKPWRFVAKSLL